MINTLVNLFLFRKNIYLTQSEMDILGFTLLKKQLLYAYQNIPYYRLTFNKVGLNPKDLNSVNDLSFYPIITKDQIRLNSPQFCNQKFLLNTKFKSHTSGSTGQPMWTYYDMISWFRKKYLAKIRARFECGIKLSDKIVIFEPLSSVHADVRNKSIISSLPFLKFKIFSIYEPFDLTIKKLNLYSPQALYGPPSYFFRLGQFMLKKNQKLSAVKKIFTSSEYLQENVRQYIENNFNAEVFDIYGSTEFKEVAWECEKHEGYHINEDEVFVEILKDGKPAPQGEIGNIVITDLRNKTMPLIRFQLLDKGMLIKEKCSCGRTFSMMKPFAGRSSEYITLQSGKILSPYLFTTSIEQIKGLLQYQIVQTGYNKIVVNVISDIDDYFRIADNLKKILTNITGNLMNIDIQLKTKIDIEENGKLKVVKNLTLEEKEIDL